MAGKPIVISIVGDNRSLRSSLGDSESRLTRFGRTAARVGVRGGLALAGGLAVVGVAAVKSASQAQQSLGATETVFGRFAQTVIRRSNEAAEAVGLSANEYRELANVMGASLAGAGIPLKRVTGLTDQLNRRAADLAATFGGSTREAVEAMGSLLRGEADPIERYGISIKQADVNARLAAKGLGKLTGEERKQAEMTARLDLLMVKSARSAGAFAKESGTLANRQQVLGAKVEDLKTKFGNVLLPVLTDVTDVLINKAVPAAEDAAVWFARNKDEIGDFGQTIASTVLPPLRTLVEVGTGVGKFFAGLPGPVQSAALQAGAFALVLPRLTTGFAAVTGGATLSIARIRQFHAEMTYGATRTAILSGAMSRLGGAARSLGGVGGMMAITAGAQASDRATGTLLTTLGGAATGFSVGGPIGAAVGGLGGLIYGLARKTDDSKGATDRSKQAWATYGQTLDGVTGKITAATREMALQELEKRKLLPITRSLGISDRQAVEAITRGGPARRRLVTAINDEQRALNRKRDALVQEHGWGTKQVRQFENEARGRRRSLAALEAELGSVHAAVVEKRKLNIATGDLGKAYDKLPKHIKTKVEAANFQPTLKGVRDLIKDYNGKLDKRTVRTIVEAAGIPATREQLGSLDRYANEISRTRELHINVIAHTAQAGAQIAAVTDRANGRVGPASLDPAGLKRLSGMLQTTAGQGLAAVVTAQTEWLRAKKLSGAQIKALTTRLRPLNAQLVANAAAQAKNTAQLTNARNALAALKEQSRSYAASVKDSLTAFGSIVGLGTKEDGSVSFPNLLDQLKDRANQVKRYADLIRSLTDQKLNQTTLGQLLAAGVEGGLATAEAIAAGGAGAIAQVNTLTTQIGQQAASLGQSAAQTFFGTGITAAQGLVDGLETQQATLNATGTRLGNAIAAALTNAVNATSAPAGARAARGFADGFNAALRPALNQTSGRRAPHTVQIVVNVPPTANQAEIGRQIAKALDAYYKTGGRRLAY